MPKFRLLMKRIPKFGKEKKNMKKPVLRCRWWRRWKRRSRRVMEKAKPKGNGKGEAEG